MQQKRQCNKETHLAFLDYVKAFDKETYCLKHYKAKYSQLLRSHIEIHSGNKTKVKIINHQKYMQLITKSDKADLYHPPYSTCT